MAIQPGRATDVRLTGPTNQTTHEYVYLAGSLVAIVDHAWPSNAVTALKYQHTDALGSPVAVTDQNRTVIEQSEYEPYGYLLNRPLKDGPGYAGHVSDAATGLSYMQQRYYDPKMGGRFLSVDPVTATSVGGNFNRYWYANNNPYRFIDPDGREAACVTLQVNCFDSGGTFAQKAETLGAFGGMLVGGLGGAGLFSAIAQQVSRHGAAGAALANADKIAEASVIVMEATAGTSIAVGGGYTVFRNLRAAGDEIGPTLKFSASKIQEVGYSGRLNYVVTESGALVLGRSGHTTLSQGAGVFAAGEARFVNGALRSMDNASGHYRPSGESARRAAEAAFKQAGFDSAKKYSEGKF